MMIPDWYAAGCMAAAGVGGYLSAQLWPIVTNVRVTRERRHLERERRRTARIVAELRRLTSWAPSDKRWEDGLADNWSLPVSPRLTDRDRIEAAKRAALNVPVGTVAMRHSATVAVRHAAPPVNIDWYRNEHAAFTRGWIVERLNRLASTGKTFVWKPAEHELVDYQPKHAAWSVDTGELKAFRADISAEEARRWDVALAALVQSPAPRLAIRRSPSSYRAVLGPSAPAESGRVQ